MTESLGDLRARHAEHAYDSACEFCDGSPASRMAQAADAALAELVRATGKFARFNSPHEGWAVIREELDELWEHVKANTGQSPDAGFEAIQVAAMALRYAYDLCMAELPLPDSEATS